MGSVFRRIGALHRSQAGLIGSCSADAIAILQYIHSFAQMVEEEVSGSIFDIYIITDSITPIVTGYTADRFEAGSPLVFLLYKVHRTVYTNAQTGNDLIAYLKNRLFSNRLQLRGIVHHTFYIELFLYIQLSSLLSHIADR